MTQNRRAALGLITALCLLPLPLMAQSVLTGTYRAEGRNPDGSTYTGAVRIADHGGLVAVAWEVGGQAYAGTGTLEGRVLSVDWGDQHPVIYVVMPNGDLHGTWADGRALERLLRE